MKRKVWAVLAVLGLLLGLGGAAQAYVLRGTGTGALIGGDLTDPENDGQADANVNYNATFTSTDEPGFGGGEFSFNVFDNRVGGGNNKWCCNDPGGTGHQLTAQFAAPIVLQTFTITSSNDSPGRDPSIWKIQGSNDGTNFTDIYSHNTPGSAIWTARNQVAVFEGGGKDFATPAAYSYIRYNVEDTVSGNHALNELEYFDAPPPPGRILGTGTGALRHDGITAVDMTDPENDGLADANVNYNAVFTADDEPGFGGGEFSFNAFDNRVGGGNNKWCCNDASPGNPLYGPGHQLTAEFPAAFKLGSFTITSSNDTPARDPLDWKIQGSNDGVNFTDIFSSGGVNLWPTGARNQVILLEAGTDYPMPATYKYIRYSVTDTVGANNHALNELEYFDADYVPPPDAFNVRMIKISGGGGSNDSQMNNTTEARAIAANATGLGLLTIGPKKYNVTIFLDDTTNAVDYSTGGNFSLNYPFPNGSATAPNDTLLSAQAFLEIPQGVWTIAVGSDDGRYLELAGILFDNAYGQNNVGGAGTNNIGFEGTTGHNRSLGAFTVGPGGLSSELFSLFFERGGGDSFEISLARGNTSSFNTTDFQLLRDGLYGWRVSPDPIGAAGDIPEPATMALFGLAVAGFGGYLRRRRRA